MKYAWYYAWHLKPQHKRVHHMALSLYLLLIVSILVSTFYPQATIKAANYTKSWTTTDDFNTASNQNLTTTTDQTALSRNTTNYTENFLNTTYKDAVNNSANWDETAHKLSLPGDPANGTPTDLQAKWKQAVAVNETVASVSYDSVNRYIYMGGSIGAFVAYKPSTGEMIPLVLKIKAVWGTNTVSAMAFDSTNGIIYFSSSDKIGALGAYKGGSDPANGTFYSLETKVTSDWSGGKVQSLTYDSVNSKIYLGGLLGGFGVFSGGFDPASGTWLNLTSKISASWSSNPVNGLTFDVSAKNIYLAGGASTVKKFGVFTPGSDPANGTWLSLDTKILDADWGSNLINALYYDSVNSKVYLGGQNSKFGVFTGGSDPANGTWVSLTSKIMGDWAGTTVARLNFDQANGMIYLTGGYRLGAFKGGSDPANGTYYALGSKFGADWPSIFSDVAYDSFGGNIYVVGGYGRFGYYPALAVPSGGTSTILFDKSAPHFKAYAQIFASVSDTINNFVYLGDDGGNFVVYNTANGVATSLKTKISGSWGNGAINAMAFDSANGVVYLAGASGRFGAFKGGADPVNGTFTYLNSKITADWSSNAVNGLAFDSNNSQVYLGGANGKFGAFKGGSDPVNGVWNYLSAKISADWAANSVQALSYDSINHKLYLGGATGKFGVFTGGSDPANGTWLNLYSKISTDWNGNGIMAMTFDTDNGFMYMGGTNSNFSAFKGGSDPANASSIYLSGKISADFVTQAVYSMQYSAGKVFIGGANAKFGVFTGGSTPANGSWAYLNNKISSSWEADGNQDRIYAITYIPSLAMVYFAGASGKFMSYLVGYSNNKNGVSLKVNSTTQKILGATLMATVNAPANTGLAYFVSNNGGTDWEETSLGVPHTFGTVGNDLRWKINLTTTNVLITPEVSQVQLNYVYYNSNSGTQNFVFDASSQATPYLLAWSYNAPTNTSLAFKIRSASQQAGLAAATWSETKNQTQSPVNLRTLMIGGSTGLAENRWVEIQVDYATTDGLNSPVLNNLDYTYVINITPEIQGVVASQAQDGSKTVQINYELRDQDTNSNPYNAGQVEVTAQYSIDSGVSWQNIISSSGFGYKNVNQSSFTSYQATWDVGTDLPNSVHSALVRLLVNDHEQAKNLAQVDSAQFSIDTKAPVTGASPLVINGGATKTKNRNLTIGLNVLDDSDKEVSVVEDGGSFTSWQPYSATIPFTITSSGDGNKIIKVKVRDIYQNELDMVLSGTIELDTFAPSPSHTVLVDGSITSTEDYRILLSWDTLNNTDFTSYVIERSLNNQTDFAELTSFTDRAANAYSDSHLDPANTYYYRMYSLDELGNQSAYSSIVSLKPSGTDSTPPTITGVNPNMLVTDNTITVSWLTDENSSSYIEYGLTISYGDIQGKEELVTSHTVTVGGLNPDTSYHFRVRSTDESGNLVLGDDSVIKTDLSRYDTTAPTLVNGNPQVEVTDISARVTWSTNEASDSFVEFGLSSEYGKTQGKIEYVTDHVVEVSGLSPETSYNFRVLSRDSSGNLLTGLDHSFTTAQNSLDVIAPKVTGPDPKATAATTSAQITWLTDEQSDSFVDFGKTTDYGFTQGKVEEVKEHTVELIGLESETMYYFRVRTRDVAGNLTVGKDFSFKTLSAASKFELPNITGATAQKAGADPEEVTIIWATDKPSSSQVMYGLTETLLDKVTVEDPALNTAHYVQIKKLKPNTKYYYKVRSVDQYGNERLDEVKYFVTTDTSNEAPTISSVKVTDITMNSAIITWKTGVVATSVLKYGKSLEYGNNVEDMSLGSTTVHTVRVSELESGTEYHFRVAGLSTANMTISSDDYVFSTLTLPVISDINILDVSANKATITWRTNIGADSFVDFGTDSAKLDESQGRSEEVMEHTVTLGNLKPATDYLIRLKSRDKYANLAVAENKSFKTIIDTTPPEIKDLKSETSIITDANGDTKAQAIISWSTDEPATSMVKYSMGVVAGDSYAFSTTEDSNLTTSHIVIISNLQPSTTYHMMIVSKDASSNIGVSDDYTILTLNQDKSLLQYVIQILESKFFWIRGIFK